jgi:hypothetical protein
MKNKIALPQIPYIVFELVKIKEEDYQAGRYKAVQDEVVFLAAFPDQFDYSLVARDAVSQTYSNVFLEKYDFAPERCSISGTFGVKQRFIAGTYMDGWSRLKQFENDIIRKSKKVQLGAANGDEERFLYALNYYDFWWQRFGNINISSFRIRGSARENTQLVRYSSDFLIIGDLIDVESNDMLLSGLKSAFGPDGFLDNIYGYANDFLADINTEKLGIATAGLDVASLLVSEAAGFISGFAGAGKKTYQNIKRLF